MVVIYRVGRLTYFLGRRLVKVPHFAMVNLIAARRLVPELIQDAMTPSAIARNTLELLDDSDGVRAMRRGLSEVKAKLGGGGASRRAAQEVISVALGRGAMAPAGA
jgi:lipid-A-disaccharide synthase